MTTTKKRIGRPTTTDPRVHRYNFKLTTEENIRFKQMLCKAGLEHNRSRFIV
ncbi:mobilization protein, partial [Alistipes onderdonkii]